MDYMKRARKRKKLTQQQLADLLHVSVSCICLYENAKRLPSVDMAKQIGRVLGFKWTRFYEGSHVDVR